MAGITISQALVLGHTRCGAVTTAVSTAGLMEPLAQATGCQHIEPILRDIQTAIDPSTLRRFAELPKAEQNAVVDKVARANVLHTVAMIAQTGRFSRGTELVMRLGRGGVAGGSRGR